MLHRLLSFPRLTVCMALLLATLQPKAQPGTGALSRNSIPGQMKMVRQVADSLFNIDPGAATRWLSAGEKLAEENNEKTTADVFSLYRHVYLLRAALPGTKHPEQAKELLDCVSAINDPREIVLKVHGLQTLAEYHWNTRRDYTRALELHFQAFTLYSGLPDEACPFKAWYVYEFAGKFYHFRDFENAKGLLLTVGEKARDAGDPGAEVYYNLLGLCYRNLAMYDSAEHYLKIAHEKAVLKKHDIYAVITNGNIGITYYYQERFSEAIPLLEEDVRYCMEKNRAADNASKSLTILADIYLQTGNVSKAAAAIHRVGVVLGGEELRQRYDLLEFYYPVAARIEAKLGNMVKAYAFADSSLAVKDSLAGEKNALVLSGAQSVLAARAHMAEIARLTDEKKLQVWTRNGLLAGVLLLGALALLFINRQKIQGRRKQEKMAAEKQLVDAELAAAATQLQLFTRTIQEKNTLIEQVTARLEAMEPAGAGVMATDEWEILTQLRESTILTDGEWECFRKLFEKVHGGFLERLRIKVPGLSPAETRFMALTRLQLSNKEMAGMLGTTTDAVRMNKHRLRRKLNLPADASIEELIASL